MESLNGIAPPASSSVQQSSHSPGMRFSEPTSTRSPSRLSLKASTFFSSHLRKPRRSSHTSTSKASHQPSALSDAQQEGQPNTHDFTNWPRRGLDLAAIASSVLKPTVHKPREDEHVVRYIAQIDIEGYMMKRSKVGPSSSVYVVLEGTALSVSKSKTSSVRHRVNVRVTPVHVDVECRELRIYVPMPGKDKLLRLVISSEQSAIKWNEALENAVCSDITEYYDFGSTLGSGAYGEVVKAVHTLTNEVRAVKIIRRSSNMKSQEHLDSEIQVMKSISHPNIVKTFQIFDLRKTIYIVMEFVPGGDLFDFVSQHDCLTEKQGSETMRSIFKAVDYLHRSSIVHRDLKPENILCVNDTWPLTIKVSDFGFANFLDPTKDADDTMHTQVGTVYFMAPEIISNKGHGPAVDLWACGVILYTILTGRLPFPGKNTTEYLSNVVRGKPLFPAILWKDISDDAKSLVKALLNADPNKRLTSLAALQHRWIEWPDATYGANEIRRDRSNLHSKRRRLFKARKAIIAVAMAHKFKATIPHVVDAMGDSTKKVAGVIEHGVRKTADGIERGFGEIASGVINIGDGIAEGTKKVGEGTKKVAMSVSDGTKKVAGGIGTGVKKTMDGMESGARKVGEGVRKTADGIETGFKKTADGLGHGVKKTAGGLERGVKLTSESLKRSVDRLLADRAGQTDCSRDADGTRNRRHTESLDNAILRAMQKNRSPLHKRPASSEVSGQPTSADVITKTEGREDASSAEDYMSAIEEHSETEEGWERHRPKPILGFDRLLRSTDGIEEYADRLRSPLNPLMSPVTISPYTTDNGETNTNTGFNVVPNLGGSPAGRPKLELLSGLTMGLSDETMAGSSPREYRQTNVPPIIGLDDRQLDLLRKTSTLLMTSKS